LSISNFVSKDECKELIQKYMDKNDISYTSAIHILAINKNNKNGILILHVKKHFLNIL
jgi:hypothetical protein